MWRGVEDVHEIEAKFLDSTEARKLHRLAGEMAEIYAVPARLVKGSEVEAEPEPEAPDSAESEENTEQRAAPIREDGIMRPTQLLDAALAAGRTGLSISRYTDR